MSEFFFLEFLLHHAHCTKLGVGSGEAGREGRERVCFLRAGVGSSVEISRVTATY